MLYICEGLDRTGKSSVAAYYESQGFRIIHQSAPPKGQTSDNFLEEQLELIQSAAHEDIFLDRSYYGEGCCWPMIYGRNPLINEEGLEVLREMEETVGIRRILMVDPNSEAHWQRCVDNNEPLTKVQFIKARTLYSAMADKYGFERKTLKDFPDAIQPLPAQVLNKNQVITTTVQANGVSGTTTSDKSVSSGSSLAKSAEQIKLEKANAINDILSKRIIKSKGSMYDEVERGIRHFLNGELGKILGSNQIISNTVPFNNEEVELLKFFCQRLKNKENN